MGVTSRLGSARPDERMGLGFLPVGALLDGPLSLYGSVSGERRSTPIGADHR